MSLTIVETATHRFGNLETMARPYTTAWAPDPRYPPRDPSHQPAHYHSQPPQDPRLPPPGSFIPRAPDDSVRPQVQSPQHSRFPPGYHGAPSTHPAYVPSSSAPPPPRHSPSVFGGQHQRHHEHRPAQNHPSMVPNVPGDSSQAYSCQRGPYSIQEQSSPEFERSSFSYTSCFPAFHPPGNARPGGLPVPTNAVTPRISVSSSPATSPSDIKSDPMRIADIISNGDGKPAIGTRSASSNVRFGALDAEYKLRIRQQPIAARSCGFGERDRRVIDPPPIIQLLIESSNLNEDEIKRRLRYCHYVMNCSIYDETGTKDAAFMPEEYRQQRRLMGSLVGAPFVGKDEFGEEGCFFCFPDLSCRTPGSFRLKFSLVMIDPARAKAVRHFPTLVEVMTGVFHVYSAKDFPGMQASTELTKRLKEQGCIISIKKGANDKGKIPRGYEDSSEDEDMGGMSSQSKKQRRLSRR